MPYKSAWHHYQLALRHSESDDTDGWRKARSFIERAIDGASSNVPWQFHLVHAWCIIKTQHDDDDWWHDEDVISSLEQSTSVGGASSPDVRALLGYALYRQARTSEALPHLLASLGQTSFIPRCSVLRESDLVALTCETLAARLEEFESSADFTDSHESCTVLLKQIDAAPLNATALKRILRAEVLACRAFLANRMEDGTGFISDLSALRLADPDHPRLQIFSPRVEATSVAVPNDSSVATFTQVAGSDQAGTFTNELRRIFRLHFPKHENRKNALRTKGYSSYLVHGPSGCGKTYVINAFAGQYFVDHGKELPIVRMKINELMNKWLGESEKAITAIIDEAIDKSPSILFADELDAMGQGRSSSGQDWRNSQVAHFLQELDRLRSSGRKVLFFGSTNHLQMIDLAIVRRFDDLIAADMPDEETRRRVFEVHLAREEAKELVPTSIDWTDLIKISHGLTPGDIERAIRQAFSNYRGQILDRDGDSDPEPMPYSTLADAVKRQDPHHVREWLNQTSKALRQAGYGDRADALDKKYQPFIKGDTSSKTTSASHATATAVPSEAWDEVPKFQ